MPPATDRRRAVAHYGVPALFLLVVTVAVLLIRAGLESGSSSAPATVPKVTIPAQPTTSTRRKAAKPHAQYYTVQSGDTFGSIASRTGISVAQLEQLNPGVSSNSLQVGQKLRVK